MRRRTSTKRDAARQDVFDYIEVFYNQTRKHINNGMLSPVDYKKKQQKMNEADAWETRVNAFDEVARLVKVVEICEYAEPIAS